MGSAFDGGFMGRTDLLFAQPSFLTGLARAVDIGATLSRHSYNEAPTPAAADAVAMASDWATVGEDIRNAVAVVATSAQTEEEE